MATASRSQPSFAGSRYAAAEGCRRSTTTATWPETATTFAAKLGTDSAGCWQMPGFSDNQSMKRSVSPAAAVA